LRGDPVHVAVRLGVPGVDEEVDARALERGVYVACGREEVRGVGVDEELGDDGGLGDDVVIELDGWDEAALWNMSAGVWLLDHRAGLCVIFNARNEMTMKGRMDVLIVRRFFFWIW
jgi:hypothetical protein